MIPFIVISYACFALCIVVVLLGRKGTEEDKNLRRMKTLGKDVVKADYKNVETSFYERNIKPMIDKMSNKNNENQSKSARVKAENEQIAKKLRKAGLHISVSNFKFFKMAFIILTIVLFLGISILLINVTQYFFIPILVGVVLALLGPNMFLNSKVKSHQGAIRAQLADTLDLMSVCMEAGLSFDASLVKISERMEGPLIDELITVFKQIQLGRNRNDALKDLSNSTDVVELKTFVSAVIQANQLGIPITNVLKAQSEQLRINKREEIKTVAAKVPTKMTIPTVFLILPAIICIVLGPVIIQVKNEMGGAGGLGGLF